MRSRVHDRQFGEVLVQGDKNATFRVGALQDHLVTGIL